MALLNTADVVQGVANLLDDPSQSRIDVDYVIPFINLRWATLTSTLSMLGLQYSEETAVFDVPIGTTDFSNFMIADQPLASMLRPISVEWKPQGTPDTSYTPSNPVNELADVDAGSVGLLEYGWIGGTITVTPSAEIDTARVRFKAMSTTLVDPTDETIHGVGEILAYRVAEIIAAIRNNPLKADLKAWGDDALDSFCAAEVMRQAAILNPIPPTHRRGSRSGITFTMPPGSDF